MPEPRSIPPSMVRSVARRATTVFASNGTRSAGRARRAALLLAAAANIPSAAAGQAVCSPEWSLTETLRIGSPEGEILQFGASDVEVGPDGTIYLTQYQTPYITVLTPDGRPSGQIGRQGQGPGEFSFAASALEWFGDTLTSVGTSAIHYFSTDGTEYRQVRHRTFAPPNGEYRVLTSAFPAADGSVVGFDFDVYGGIERGYHPVVQMSGEGELVRELYRVSIVDRYVQDDEIGIFAPPVGPWPYPVADRDGVVVVHPGPDARRRPTFELLRLGLAGDTLLRRAVPYDPVRITRGMGREIVDRYVDFRLEHRGAFETATPARVAQQIRDLVETPDAYPPVRWIRPGHDGTIWLLREPGGDEEDRWEVYGPGGELEGTVRVTEGRSSPFPFSPRMNLIRATRDEIWATTIDDLEVPYLHRFSVDRGCGA